MNQPTEDPATEPLTPERLAEIQARANAATPGPWWNDVHEIYGSEHVEIPAMCTWIGETCNVGLDDNGEANASFVANARQDVVDLIAEIGWLAAELADRTAELTTSAGVAEQAWERNTALVKENARLRAELNAKAEATR